MNTISFITANFVARELGYHMSGDWAEGDSATQRHYQPLETFGERFDAMLREIREVGFEAIDLWAAHLNPAWARRAHIEAAQSALKANGLRVSSLAAWCNTVEDIKGFCKIANALEVNLIAGGAPVLRTHRSETIAVLKEHGIRFAIENHPEKNAAELLEQIGDGANGLIGAAPDTGWWALEGANAADTLRELRDHIFTVHLKDIVQTGVHLTCALGAGIVGAEACVKTLRTMNYTGTIGIEHEPYDHDPRPEVAESKSRLEAWLKL
jgi:L-ribulose-5-phosphate 3-epimerase